MGGCWVFGNIQHYLLSDKYASDGKLSEGLGTNEAKGYVITKI